MARSDDGELYLAIEGATEAELQRGLAVAREIITRARLFVDDAFEAAALCAEAWNCPAGVRPPEPSDEDYVTADIVHDAELAAIMAAGYGEGTLGLLPREQQTRHPPVIRDLFGLMTRAETHRPGRRGRIVIWRNEQPTQIEMTWGLEPLEPHGEPISL